MFVRYFGPFFQRTGYAKAAQDYALCLKAAGVDFDLVPIIPVDELYAPGPYEVLRDHLVKPNAHADDPTHVIVHTIPYGLDLLFSFDLAPPESVKRVAITTWETSKIPEDAANRIAGHYDLCLVPSVFCKEALIEGGVPERGVKVVPHAFDPNRWFQPTTQPSTDPDDVYTFYTILTWCTRKEPIGLLKAYLTEFKEEDNVLLRIKTPGFNAREVEELARGLGLPYYPPVDMLCENYSEQQMFDLHASSHCYVTCARAEGFGLGAFEACLVGNPVIATDYSGLRDFLTGYHKVGWVPFFLTPAYTPELESNTVIKAGGMTIRPVIRNDHTGICGSQYWAEPDLYTLKSLLREAYENRWTRSIENRDFYRETYSYRRIGMMMKGLLEGL